jgi:hypothetical protein
VRYLLGSPPQSCDAVAMPAQLVCKVLQRVLQFFAFTQQLGCELLQLNKASAQEHRGEEAASGPVANTVATPAERVDWAEKCLLKFENVAEVAKEWSKSI